jgi:hypothetical protein
VDDELAQVVLVERPALQPLDRPEHGDPLGDRLLVRTDEVDLGIVRPRPVTADRTRPIGQLVHPSESFPNERLDGHSAP